MRVLLWRDGSLAAAVEIRSGRVALVPGPADPEAAALVAELAKMPTLRASYETTDGDRVLLHRREVPPTDSLYPRAFAEAALRRGFEVSFAEA